MIAPSSAVIAPTPAMIDMAAGERAMISLTRLSRTTPDVTMVAAWMSAETGVGPAMASGSHT